MKNRCFNVLVALIAVAVLLVCFTACSNSVSETTSTGFVRFDGRTDASRSLTQKDANIYKIEDLYWTYTAKKIDGLYTEGESVKKDSTHANPGSGSTVYVERPVKDGPATGLDAQVGPFATGDWEFNIYGYVNCVVESGVAKYETLVYTGVTSPVNIAVKKLTGSPVVIPEVAFELTATDEVPVTGTLAFDRVKLTLPETDGLFSKTTSASTGLKKSDGSAYPDVDTVLKVRVWDVTDGSDPSDSNLIATSTTPITADYKTGDVVNLYPFEIESGKETVSIDATYKGTRTFLFAAEYQDRYTKYASKYVAKPVGSTVYDTYLYKYASGTDESKIYENGFAPVGEVKAFMVQFYSGSVTTVSGDINDMVDATEGGSPAKFGVAVARILKSTATTPYTDASYDYYATLADAFAAYSDPDRPVILLRDVSEETITLAEEVTVSNPDYKSLKNVRFTGAFDTVFNLGSGTSRVYKYQSGVLKNFSCDASHTWIETAGGTLDVTAAGDNVIHAGTATDITVNGAASYKVSADVTGTLKLTAGHVEIGEYVSVGTVNVTATSSTNASIKGYKTSSVGNMTSIRDGGTDKGGIFKKVTLHSNLATDTTKALYGIEGMYTDIPDFKTGSSGSPLFTNGKLVFVNWNTVSGGTGAMYLNKDKVVAGSSVVNLYAQWSKPIGGTVFYVDKTNGVSYTFFDENGEIIDYMDSGLTADKLACAFSYAETGRVEGMPDRFYVLNDLTFMTYGNLTRCVNDGKNYYVAISKIYGLDSTLLSVTKRNFGSGKENTRQVRALSNYSTDFAPAPWKTTSATYNDKYSVWYLLDKWNAGGTVLGNFKNETGTGDWYIPSLEEIHKIFDFYVTLAAMNAAAHRGYVTNNFFCYSSTVTKTDGTPASGSGGYDFRYINPTGVPWNRAANEQTNVSPPTNTQVDRGTVFIRSF